MTTQFIITKDWLNKFRTRRGGYTKEQVKSLELRWPLLKGWKQKIIGKCISLAAKENFEYYAEKPNKKQVREVLTIDNCFAYLFKNVNYLGKHRAYDLYMKAKEASDKKPEFYNLNP